MAWESRGYSNLSNFVLRFYCRTVILVLNRAILRKKAFFYSDKHQRFVWVFLFVWGLVLLFVVSGFLGFYWVGLGFFMFFGLGFFFLVLNRDLEIIKSPTKLNPNDC